jgi:hypothetical protein
MPIDPVTGPFTREAFQELVAAPFGEAGKRIRKVDPFWGRKEGEKIDFEVTCVARLQGRAVIKAANQKEADKLSDDLGEHDFDWGGYGCDDIDIIDVKPLVER